MWWKYAGFGQFIIRNRLNEETFQDTNGGKETQVRGGRFTRAQVGGVSLNTLLGTQKAVVVPLNDKGRLQRPGSESSVSLTWWLLRGPPVPDTWELNFTISAPDNEQQAVSGRIALPTPRGKRPIMRFTFHYALDDNRDAWYAVQTESYDWRTEAWESAATETLGDAPAVRAAPPVVHAT